MDPELILSAYANGIFPMQHGASRRIDWYRPDPRAIIPLSGFRCSRSLMKTLRRSEFSVRVNSSFHAVMEGCADREEGTWIGPRIFEVYGELHRSGRCHSVEAWREGELAGGLYGISIGAAFMAESMFHRQTDASKVALAGLVSLMKSRGMSLLDTQYLTPHLESLGAVEIPCKKYLEMLAGALTSPDVFPKGVAEYSTLELCAGLRRADGEQAREF